MVSNPSTSVSRTTAGKDTSIVNFTPSCFSTVVFSKAIVSSKSAATRILNKLEALARISHDPRTRAKRYGREAENEKWKGITDISKQRRTQCIATKKNRAYPYKEQNVSI